MARVLLLEPYDDIRYMLALMLRHGGHDVVVAADGRGAVEALERELFACVVVASPVPVRSGGRDMLFLEYIEQHCPNSRPALVVITNRVDSSDVLSAAQRVDACAVFAKPFSAPDLLAAVDDCAAGRRPPQRWHGIPDALVPALRVEGQL